MPGRSPEGIQIAETPGAGQSIAPAKAQSTAFVGRTLRGPLNCPVTVRSFADFQQIFGGLWQPSPLSYAVEQFFDQGGRHAVVVRVANGATPVTISLRCERGTLQLEARAPGTREFLRASVDYDGVEPDRDSFNLVIQRVRVPGSERIEEQESFRGLSVDPGSQRFVAAALLESHLVRVRGDVPQVRPDRTLMAGTNLPVGYVSSNPDGDDGRPITDYDIIGSATRLTGLFALQGVENLAFLYIPPLSRTADIGASALLVAARFCRDRRIMLIVDPPAAWESPVDAIRGMKGLNFHSDNATMFFPRIVSMDRLRGRNEVFGNGGAVAGILTRAEESFIGADPEPLLRAGARPARDIESADRAKLGSSGINVLQSVRSTARSRPPLRTLAGGANASADWGFLGTRRFALQVVNAIERGTRWAVVAPHDPQVWLRITQQVHEFLGGLQAAGAFSKGAQEPAYNAICDERINELSTNPGAPEESPAALHILVEFAAAHPGEYHSYLITHTVRGATVRPVAVNRLEAALVVSGELEQEITIRVQHPRELMRALAH